MWDKHLTEKTLKQSHLNMINAVRKEKFLGRKIFLSEKRMMKEKILKVKITKYKIKSYYKILKGNKQKRKTNSKNTQYHLLYFDYFILAESSYFDELPMLTASDSFSSLLPACPIFAEVPHP